MKLTRLADGGTGVAVDVDGTDAHVVDIDGSLAAFERHDPRPASVVREALPTRGCSWSRLIDQWDGVRDALHSIVQWTAGEGRTVSAHDHPPPLAGEGVAIAAIGANFVTHAARSQFAIEGGGGAAVEARAAALLEARRSGVPPWGFWILPRTIVGSGRPIGRPTGVTKLDYEGEVAVVLRRPSGDDVPQVWGVTAFDDVSVRDPYFKVGPRIDEGPLTWVLQKNFVGGSACGPWVVVDEGLDENDLGIVTSVNGERRQEGRTSEMVYSFADVADYLGRFVPLRTGDMISSGTPAGTAFESGADGPFLRDGDEVRIEIEGVGVLINSVSAGVDPGQQP